MCGSAVSSGRSLAAGVINQLKGSGWIGLADELAKLDDDDFEKLIQAFDLYRQAIKQESRSTRSKDLPKRKKGGA
jgi:hypothetical protein